MNRALAWLREWRAMPLIRTFAAAALLLYVVPTPAFARWVTMDVPFKTAQLDRPGGFTAIDSLVTSSGSGQHFDTTAALNTDDWEFPENGLNGYTAAGDTLEWFVFSFAPIPGGSVTVAADTVYVTPQVSLNGHTWITATVTQNSDPLGYTLEQGTSNAFYWAFEQHVGGVVGGGGIPTTQEISGATAPSDNTMWGVYPLIRFIVQGDHTGVYQAKLRYWVEDN